MGGVKSLWFVSVWFNRGVSCFVVCVVYVFCVLYS